MLIGSACSMNSRHFFVYMCMLVLGMHNCSCASTLTCRCRSVCAFLRLCVCSCLYVYEYLYGYAIAFLLAFVFADTSSVYAYTYLCRTQYTNTSDMPGCRLSKGFSPDPLLLSICSRTEQRAGKSAELNRGDPDLPGKNFAGEVRQRRFAGHYIWAGQCSGRVGGVQQGMLPLVFFQRVLMLVSRRDFQGQNGHAPCKQVLRRVHQIPKTGTAKCALSGRLPNRHFRSIWRCS